MWMPGVSTKMVFNKSGRLVQFPNGTARLFGKLTAHDNKRKAFRVDVSLNGFVRRWQPEPSGSPKLELKDQAYAPHGPIMPVTWRYYTELDGLMVGLKDLLGGAIALQRTGPSFQMGKGANGKNRHLGASTWVTPTVLSQPMKTDMKLQPQGHADFNLDLTRRLGKACALPGARDLNDMNNEQHPAMEGNHVTNGSFEEPVLPKSWNIYTASQVPGWAVTWNEPGACLGQEAVMEIQRSALVLPATDGNQLTELDTHCHAAADRLTTVKLSQAIPTVPGHWYELSFAFAARPGNHGNQAMQVTVDNQLLFVQQNLLDTGELEYVTLIFKADRRQTSLSFSDIGLGNTHGTLLDDIQVHDVTDYYLH